MSQLVVTLLAEKAQTILAFEGDIIRGIGTSNSAQGTSCRNPAAVQSLFSPTFTMCTYNRWDGLALKIT